MKKITKGGEGKGNKEGAGLLSGRSGRVGDSKFNAGGEEEKILTSQKKKKRGRG